MALSDSILVIMLFLTMGVISASAFRKAALPYTVLLVLLGIGLQLASRQWSSLESLNNFTLTSDVILFVFLPVLIFEAGLGLNARELTKEIIPILMLAIPALLISTFIVGFGTAWVLGIPLIVALIFGALISATDPVAVIALFKELGVPRRLTVLVEGESLFNDATAIVLFNILIGLALAGGLHIQDIGHAGLSFLKVFLGGALIGSSVGFSMSLIINWLQISGPRLMILFFAIAYLSFIVAEHLLHVSGVMAVAFSAVSAGIFIMPGLAQSEEHTLHHTWEFLADICNTLLFILVGLSVNLENFIMLLGPIIAIYVLVQLSRASVIYSIVPISTKLFRLHKITSKEQHIMWWGGLKGGLAIAMVLAIPDEIADKQMLIDLTAGIVTLSLLVNAPSIKSLIHLMKINTLTDTEEYELKQSLTEMKASIKHSLNELNFAEILSEKDEKHINRFLEKRFSTLAPKIMAEKQELFYRMNLLSWEVQELHQLYKRGLIQSVTYLGLLDEKRNYYDLLVSDDKLANSGQRYSDKLTIRKIDQYLVRFLREKEWAAPLLARFLNLRLNEYLNNQFTNIMVFSRVQQRLQDSNSIENSAALAFTTEYQTLIDHSKNNICDVKNEFPRFYHHKEVAFSLHAALLSAKTEMDHNLELGELSTKPYKTINEKIIALFDEAKADSRNRQAFEHQEHIRHIPLLKHLSDDAIKNIASHSQEVVFLKNDIIIGKGDAGNALYILLDGTARVQNDVDGEAICLFHPGDFFGEMALLGDDIRSAYVEAETSCLLLRVSRKVILKVAKEFPDILDSLEQAKQTRSH